MRDVRLVVAQAVREAEQMPAQAGPAMSDLAHHRLGDRQRAPGTAGEIDVVVDVRPGEPAHRRRGEGGIGPVVDDDRQLAGLGDGLEVADQSLGRTY